MLQFCIFIHFKSILGKINIHTYTLYRVYYADVDHILKTVAYITTPWARK